MGNCIGVFLRPSLIWLNRGLQPFVTSPTPSSRTDELVTNITSESEGVCSQQGPPADRGEVVMPVHWLYPAETSDTRNINFDIIFFHGLHSAGVENAWKSTWVSSGVGLDGAIGVCWPGVWLPEDLDGIRVLSVSYESDATKYFGMENTEDKIEDVGENFAKTMKRYGIGQRRFVLVGHGFGGLVIKSLVAEMKRLSHIPIKNPLDGALQSTAETSLKHLEGIVFYAVPHTNIDMVAYVNYLESQIQLLEPTRILKPPPMVLENLMKRFVDGLNKRPISILAFVEGKSLRDGKFVVPPESAMLQAGNHSYKLFDCDHIQVCKPSTKQHPSYLELLHFLQVCGAGKVEEPSYPPPPANLLGIEENMTKLVEVLKEESSVGLVGMGGIGKSTLVKEFYRRKSLEYEYKSILLDVYKTDILLCQRQLLKDIVKDGHYNDLDPPHNTDLGKALLQKFLSEKRLLIVLDDVGCDSVEYLIPEGVRLHHDSKIILTSRNWAALENHGTTRVEMQYLNSMDSMKLFCLHAFKETF